MADPFSNFRKRISRRDFIKITAAAGGLLLGGEAVYRLNGRDPITLHDQRILMGTVINLTLTASDPTQGQAAIEATYAAMQALTRIFDYRQSSAELCRLNRCGELDQPSAELVSLMRQAVRFGELSGGAFDVSVLPVLMAYRANRLPSTRELERVNYRDILIGEDQIKLRDPAMGITLDGIAKGRVIDGGVSQLKALGFTNILLEAGGDLLASGSRLDGAAWKVGVMNPRQTGSTQWLAAFEVTDRAVATSGDYQNSFTSDYSLNHIINPATGASPTGLASATTLAPTVMEADALSTTLMVLGVEQGLKLVEQLPGIEALLVTKDLEIFKSSGFPL
jgi:FAD:protein FMN transferase